MTMLADLRARRRPPRDERGSESVELALLLPTVGILVMAMIVIGARLWLASDRMSGVAGIAARDASIARSPNDAQTLAKNTATEALATDGLHCTNIRVTVDTSGFSAPPGTPSSVRVDVWCTVKLWTGLIGSKTLHDSAVSPLDPARDLRVNAGGSA